MKVDGFKNFMGNRVVVELACQMDEKRRKAQERKDRLSNSLIGLEVLGGDQTGRLSTRIDRRCRMNIRPFGITGPERDPAGTGGWRARPISSA